MTSNPVTGAKRTKALERMNGNAAIRVRSAEGQWHVKADQGRFRAAVQVVRESHAERADRPNDHK